MGIWYTSLEKVCTSLDIQPTARNNAQVRRAIEAGSRSIDGARVGQGQLARRFYPETATRYLDAPTGRTPGRLDLREYELSSVASIVCGGVTLTTDDYVLQPTDGPPYDSVDLVAARYTSWPYSGSPIRAIAITSTEWNFPLVEEQIGTLSAQLGSSAAAAAAVTWSTADIGTGYMLRIDDERVVIRARTWVDSGQNLGGAGLAASMADVAVTVTTGTAYAVDEVLQVDAEQLLVTAITGNMLTVVRAWNGSVLAAHTAGADVYALTGVELDRGQLGTTAAVHESGAAIYRLVVPALVDELALAETANILQQHGASYGLGVRSGESQSVVGTAGLELVRESAAAAFGRVLWAGV